ncbi:hypothetical protein Xekj_03879 [Xenorhabdus sp. KJ12.1]|nr:hypothetical protein Xekj_03879 [Xenorhabdus sp. KJ12.1]
MGFAIAVYRAAQYDKSFFFQCRIRMVTAVRVFCNGIIHILTCCQYNGWINFQRDRICAADNQDHADRLSATRAFLQLWFVGFCAVTYCNQNAIFVIQTDFTDPPATFGFRNNLFRDNLVGVFRIDAQRINRCPAFFINQFGLFGIRYRQAATTITNGHMGNFNFCTQCRSICQFICA